MPSVSGTGHSNAPVRAPSAANRPVLSDDAHADVYNLASPVAFAGFVAMTSEEGTTYLLKAGPTHEIVRTNSVDEAVYASAAISNGRIYIRGEKHLFAIGER